MRVQHDIFNTPNKVVLTLEERPTPTDYLGRREGQDLGPKMPMWRVQTEGYTDGTNQLVGVVSRDAGFFDSPDTEWISGGVNTKGPNAVAIGRHGNFFHWGFAASPKYMTAEAKLVFVNALHYAARFDGKAPVARKKKGITLRSSIESALWSMTEEGYARQLAVYSGYRAADLKRKEAIQTRLLAGEKVSERDMEVLHSPGVEDPDRFARIREYVLTEDWEGLEEDPLKVEAYVRANMGFYHPTGSWYQTGIDKELRAFGYANNELKFLAKAIHALKDPEREPLARKLLERYTECDFETYLEWKMWLDIWLEKLFFCETAGYVWLANTLDESVQTPTKIQTQPAKPASPEKATLEPTRQKPVAKAISAVPSQGGHRILVDFSVFAGWHMYTRVPENSAYVPLSLEIVVPDAATIVGDWDMPIGRPDPATPGLMLLGNTSQARCDLKGVDLSKGPVEVTCKMRYQVCDANMCMAPTTEVLTVILK